jgi:hypothetical protein
MRQAVPDFEKRFFGRLFARARTGLLKEVATHPIRSFYKARDRWYECNHPDHPMLVRDANEFLERRLGRDHVGFEWGSGGSTVWFAANTCSLVSIEHHPDWYRSVSRRLADQRSANVDFRLVPLEHDESIECVAEYPTLPSYVGQINDFPSGHFDYCLVDGHYRPACVLAALEKIKPGGFLIVDDSQWLSPAAWRVPASWHVEVRKHSGMKETTVWTKPHA